MVVLFDTNYTHPTVYTDFCYQKSITAEYHRSLLRPVYGWFARIIAQLDHYFNRSFCEYKPLDKLDLSNSFAPHRSLPLMREVDSPQGEDGGRDNYPSVKNQRFLPASLTRGALGRSRASTINRHIGICLSFKLNL